MILQIKVSDFSGYRHANPSRVTYIIYCLIKLIYLNTGLNLDQLLYKENSCMEILDLIQKLRLGQCRLLGK